MTIVLILSILILVTIAIWQITKIFELSQPAKINDSQIADNDDNNTQGKLMFAFLAFIYIITLFSFWKWGDVLLPEAASEHGSQYDSLMWITFALIFFCSNCHTSFITLFYLQVQRRKREKGFILF